MKLGDIRKLTAGLPDETELEIRDENTEEVYEIHEIMTMAFANCHTEAYDDTTEFWLQFTTNIELQSGLYSARKQEINNPELLEGE